MISEGKKNKRVNRSVLIAVTFTIYPIQICYYYRKKPPQKILPD